MGRDERQERILLLAPTGRDGEVLRAVLAQGGFAGGICRDAAALTRRLAKGGAGALVIAEEALTLDPRPLTDWVAAQPAWSDLPVIVLCSDMAAWLRREADALRVFDRLGNVSLLERPLRAETLVSAVRSALRARRRQYQVRQHLREREQAEAEALRAAEALRRTQDRLSQLNANLEQRVAEAVADRRKAEAALMQAQKMEAIGQLTGGLAHDFNNLLTAVLGNLELIAMRLPKAEAGTRRLVEGAIRAAERGARLTQQLLAFARKQTLQLRPVDANQVVRGMGDLLGHTIGNSVRVESDLAEPLWHARVDENQLVLVLLNLAINARDAMPQGGLLRIATRNVGDGDPERPPDLLAGDFVGIAVTDTGTGMTEEIRARAFEPFFTTKEHGKGTGLGLSQVYGLTKQFGGTVEIDSRVGEGTSVRFYLPRADASLAAIEPEEPAEVAAS